MSNVLGARLATSHTLAFPLESSGRRSEQHRTPLVNFRGSEWRLPLILVTPILPAEQFTLAVNKKSDDVLR